MNNIEKVMNRDLEEFEAKIGFIWDTPQNKDKELIEIHRLYKEQIKSHINQSQLNLLKAIEVEIKGFTELPVELAQTTLGYYRAIRDVLKIIKESIKGKLEL